MVEKQSLDPKEQEAELGSRRRIAAYIADLAEEMERLARGEGMDRLGERLAEVAEEARRASPLR